VTVIRPHHPLRGEQFEVLIGGPRQIVIRLRDGSTMRIPRVWTDADGARSDSPPPSETVFTVEALRELLELVSALKARA